MSMAEQQRRTIDWMEDAACRGNDVEVFFSERAEKGSRQEDKNDRGYYQARRVCARCPVRKECLTYAIEARIMDHGMFGGMSPKERKQERRRRARLSLLRGGRTI